MEVILKEDVPKLGSRGDVVKVAEGYGRNFLLPRKLAIEANAANKAVIEQMKAAAVRRSAKEKTKPRPVQAVRRALGFVQRRSGENDQLFGSVTSGDIAEALEKKGFHIDRRKIQLHEPLKTVGEFDVPVKLAQRRHRAREGGDREGSGQSKASKTSPAVPSNSGRGEACFLSLMLRICSHFFTILRCSRHLNTVERPLGHLRA